jgi:hypothetical protein
MVHMAILFFSVKRSKKWNISPFNVSGSFPYYCSLKSLMMCMQVLTGHKFCDTKYESILLACKKSTCFTQGSTTLFVAIRPAEVPDPTNNMKVKMIFNHGLIMCEHQHSTKMVVSLESGWLLRTQGAQIGTGH